MRPLLDQSFIEDLTNVSTVDRERVTVGWGEYGSEGIDGE